MLQIAIFVTPFAILIALMAWHIRRNPSGYADRSDPFPAAKRAWKRAWVAIWAMGMVAISTYTFLWYDYQRSRPRVAQPDLGRIYGEHMRGVTVYLTHAEKTRLDFSNVATLCASLRRLQCSA